MALPSELVAAYATLEGKEIDEDAGQNDQEHHGGDGRTHGLVAELELKPEKGAVEKGAQDVGRKVRAGKRTLGGIDQVERVEIADEGQDRDDPDGRQDERQLDLQELRHPGDTVELGCFDDLLGD